MSEKRAEKKKKAHIANLPKGVSVFKDGPGWRVRLGKKFTGSKPRKPRFDTLDDARDWIFGKGKEEQVTAPPIVELKSEGGNSAFQLSHEQILEATAAIKLLGDKGTIMAAVDFYLKNACPASGVKTFSELADFYIELKREKKRSEKHLKGLLTIANAFSEDFGDQLANTIRQESAEEWLKELDLEPLTIGNYIRDLRSIFREGVRRKWCITNPFANIEKPKTEDQEITCLSPADVAKLFLHCPPDLLLLLSLKIFAGLRTSELLRLDFHQVRKSEVMVLAKQAKTRTRRPVTIQPNLKLWLAKCKIEKGSIWKKGQNAYHDAINRLITASGVELPPNGFRQTFASYHYARFKNENLTAADMGNSPAMIFKHYRAVATMAESKVFWSITPETAESIAKGKESKK